jgi:hypothetical protein
MTSAQLKELVAFDLATYRITVGPEPEVDPHKPETFRKWQAWWLDWYALPLNGSDGA